MLNFATQTGSSGSGIKWTTEEKIAGHLARIMEKTNKMNKNWHQWVQKETLARSGRPLKGYAAQPFTHVQKVVDDAVTDPASYPDEIAALKKFGVDPSKDWASQDHAAIKDALKQYMSIP